MLPILPIVGFIAAIAAGVAAGYVLFLAIKLTIKAFAGIARKLLHRDKNPARQVMAADIDSMIAQCTNRKSLSELENLKQEQGVTHIVAGVDEDGNVVDDIHLIQNEDEETAYEVVDLLGDEGMVVIED